DLKGDLKEGPTIGSNAFIGEKWEPNSVARLRKNPDYFLPGIPYVDTVEFVRITDNATQLSFFRSQQAGISPSNFTRADLEPIKRSNPEIQIESLRTLGGGLAMGFDMTRAPFSDARFRQAVRMAIDYKQIQDTAFNGDGWYTTTIAVPDFDWELPEDEFKSKWLKRDVA